VPQRRCRRILKARVLLKGGPHFLAWRLKIARSTIYAVLRRYGLSRLNTRTCERPCDTSGQNQAAWSTWT